MVQRYNKTTTTETTYQYNAENNITNKKTVETVREIPPSVTTVYPGPAEVEAETGTELESAIELSPLKIFLTVAAGSLIGNLLYRAIHKD